MRHANVKTTLLYVQITPLEPEPPNPRYILTEHGLGYRFHLR
jgi:hypothetical protein